MPQIKKLRPEVISSIAAGEVIERPAYVVKELIENALDAGSTEIEIELENYGLDRIIVTDNGQGMNKEDLLLSFLPHTTSKLQSIEDLYVIRTLGFRGEALSSIASVGTLIIESQTKDSDIGYKVVISGNKIETSSPVSRNTGTKVTVQNLFENVPARKKFLKHNLTELRLISETVSHFVLSHPKVLFTLSHNGRLLIKAHQKDILERLATIFGEEFLNNALPLSASSSYISVEGFIAKPQINASSQSKLWIYINGRKVSDALIVEATKEAFTTLLMARSYPVGLLYLQMPSELVDVNVHPTKREVRFAQPNDVFSFVKDAIQEVLSKNNLTYANIAMQSAGNSIKKELREEVTKKEIAKIGRRKNGDIFQIHQSYLISETEDGFQILDQHAAHESLLYFEFLTAWQEKLKSGSSKELTPPAVIELSTTEDLLLKEHLGKLTRLGFSISEFGERTYKIDSLPDVYRDRDIKEILIVLLDSFSGESPATAPEADHHMLATLACKSAIKAGEYLEPETRKEIIEALEAKHYAYTCPHGRPVRITISMDYLARMFKR